MAATRTTADRVNREANMSGYDQSITDLLRSTIQDAQDLVQNEIALAKAELKVSMKNGGTGAGLFGAAAFLGLERYAEGAEAARSGLAGHPDELELLVPLEPLAERVQPVARAGDEDTDRLGHCPPLLPP